MASMAPFGLPCILYMHDRKLPRYSIKSTPHRRNFEGPKGLAISFQAHLRLGRVASSKKDFDPELGLLTLVQTPVYPSLVTESGWCAASCPRKVEIATSVDRVSLHSHLPSHTIPPIWFRLPSVLPLPSRLGSNLFPFAPAHRLYAVAAPALLGLDIKVLDQCYCYGPPLDQTTVLGHCPARSLSTRNPNHLASTNAKSHRVAYPSTFGTPWYLLAGFHLLSYNLLTP
ncbi:uncharacterized protein FPRO_00720 [Fusarium proliferatum ET1]|uniref:Uncharacterized protein n=1 Tax=Fusarium proliferatum (strain ET1) TaxID=1227346 RepID=A0A1L7V2M6_FUSPR|nr:uncharacterized protein FPRO_00720 [Fusarium proliferatum ET1]CZR35158.1 uncharacterized protein FPRO_00720 [Fusarium proliferatum ET1]